MTKLLAFHGKQEIKDKYIARLEEHYRADEIIKGQYWENGKGCAVGCTIHSGNHKAYEDELGIPTIIARLEDVIFEGLPNKDSKEFPLQLLKSINVGADLSKVADKFLIKLLNRSILLCDERGKKATQTIIDLLQDRVNDIEHSKEKWDAAYYAAYDDDHYTARDVASCASYEASAAASYANYARVASAAARAASYAVSAASYADRDVARVVASYVASSAACESEYKKQRDDLLTICECTK
jgi:hypothetical protein